MPSYKSTLHQILEHQTLIHQYYTKRSKNHSLSKMIFHKLLLVIKYKLQKYSTKPLFLVHNFFSFSMQVIIANLIYLKKKKKQIWSNTLRVGFLFLSIIWDILEAIEACNLECVQHGFCYLSLNYPKICAKNSLWFQVEASR